LHIFVKFLLIIVHGGHVPLAISVRTGKPRILHTIRKVAAFAVGSI
jgi:hypothetical protein